MSTEFEIAPCDKKNIKKIVDGINEYNLSKVAAIAAIWTPLEFVAKDKNGSEIGGVLGGLGYRNGLKIKYYGYMKSIEIKVLELEF